MSLSLIRGTLRSSKGLLVASFRLLDKSLSRETTFLLYISRAWFRSQQLTQLHNVQTWLQFAIKQ
jgi:hypothetical protein